MNLVGALEGGLAGTAALKVLQETVHYFDRSVPHSFLHSPRKDKKANGKNGKRRLAKRYKNGAAELLSGVLYFGLPALVGKKDKAPLWGAAMGAAAGLWKAYGKKNGGGKRKKRNRQKLYNLCLYTTAGLLAGGAIKHFPPKQQKQGSLNEKQQNSEQQEVEPTTEAKLLSTILYVDEVPVGYQISRDENRILFTPSKHTAKECCPPRFFVLPDGDSWLFEPPTIDPNLQSQIIQELRTMEAGKLLE